MFFTLSKVLWFLVEPGNLFVIVLLAGVFLLWIGRVQLGRWLLSLALLVILLLTVFPVGTTMLSSLENRFERPEMMPEQVSGIIVLGGVLNQLIAKKRGSAAPKFASGRFAEFVNLAATYPEARLVFTGGSGSLRNQELKEADFAEPLLRAWGLDTSRVIFEKQSRNTFENAKLSRALVKPKSGERWILITSAFHMPRAVGVFRRTGWEVLPMPVEFQTAGDEGLWPPSFRFLSGLNSFSSAVHEWLGLSFYWLTGRIDTLIPAPKDNTLGQ